MFNTLLFIGFLILMVALHKNGMGCCGNHHNTEHADKQKRKKVIEAKTGENKKPEKKA